MAKNKKKLHVNKTTLIVVEGYSDRAFVEHIKGMYIYRGCGVSIKIKNAKGKGSNNVVRHAIASQQGFDRCAALYDTDVSLLTTHKKSAQRKNIELIESSPCLEGLLLDILGQHVPHDSSACKAALRPQLAGQDATNPNSYSIFTKNLLDTERVRVLAIDQILTLMNS